MAGEDDSSSGLQGKLSPALPGLFSADVAVRHVMEVRGVSRIEAHDILVKVCAEGRIRAEYRPWEISASFIPGHAPTTIFRSEVLVRCLASDVLREFPPKKTVDNPTAITLPKPSKKKWQRYREDDAKIVEKMHTAINDGRAGNPNAAAALFALEAKGSGTEKSKQERLRALYVQTFQKDPSGK